MSNRQVVLSVRASVKSIGLSRIKFADGKSKPIVTVTEVQVVEGELSDGQTWEAQLDDMKEEVVDPGEEIAKTRLFVLPDPASPLVGWRIEFSFGVKQPWPLSKNAKNYAWLWIETVFVPVPPLGV